MKKSTIVLLFSMACSPSLLFAQDIIIRKNKTEIKAKVIELTVDYVKYREWDNLNGPIYNIARNKVFMINYQNGKREFINNKSEVKIPETTRTEAPIMADAPAKSAKPRKIEVVIETEEPNNKTETPDSETPDNTRNAETSLPDTSRTQEGSAYAFAPVDVTKPRGYTQFADNATYLGVSLNSIDQTTIPTFMAINDWFLSPSLAMTYGIGGNFNEYDDMNFHFRSYNFIGILGTAFYLNKALRINKKRAAFYIGAAVKYTYQYTTSDLYDKPTSVTGLSVFGRAGGKINFTRRLGIFGEVQIDKDNRPDVVAGFSISFVK